MSRFAGIVRWSDERSLQRNAEERLRAAVASPGDRRPAVISAPPAHLVFCQRIATPEDQWERQPASAGGVLSLFDGRLDDREGLADRLGLSPAGMPDGDLALAAFRRWGPDAPLEMLGEFAWAVWDGGDRRLVLSRDPSASRSLYLYRSDRVVAFATGLRALFSFTDVPREPDDQGLAEFIALYPGQGERTVYRDVLRLMPGTTMVLDQGSLRRSAAWVPRPVRAPADPRACAEAARDIVARATRARLRTLGTTAVSLSGGLDSAILAAEAARQRSPGPVLGVVLVPPEDVPLAVSPGWSPDGRAQVDALALRHPNLQTRLITPADDPIDGDPTALFVETGHPLALSPNIGWLLAAWRAARAAGARVMLTGDDGELSLTHYGSLPAVARQGDLWHALREAWRIARRNGGGLAGQLDVAFLGGRLSRLRDRDQSSRPGDWRRYSAIHPDLAEAAGIRELLLAERFPAGLLYRPPGYAEVLDLYLRRRAPTVDNVAALRQLTGLDHSSPFADRRLLDFCLSLPERMFVRDGRPRWLARTAYQDLLPTEVTGYLGKAAQNPEWFHRLTRNRSMWHAQLDRIEASPLARRALDLPRLRMLLDNWPASVEDAAAAGPAYRSTLARGLHAGAFLRWIDTDNSNSGDGGT